ncbi:cation diffusion facilitator family transporter [Pontibacter rugosus]|uniref:Cation diffusion facilitator family transporter n=1 Tax=Pontibacter rugosus TaxID=1745966 RepID=A0ABW3SQD8_9BACT
MHTAAGIVLAVIGLELMPQALAAEQPFIPVLAFVAGSVFFVFLDKGIGCVQSRFGGENKKGMSAAWAIYIGVIVAGIIMWTTGWYYADPILSAGIGLFILPRTWVLLKEAVGVLLEGTPSDVNIEELRRCIAALKGVEEVHDLHVWSLTSGVNAMSAHVVVTANDNTSYNEMLKRINQGVTSNFKISHTTIQLESRGHEENETHL